MFACKYFWEALSPAENDVEIYYVIFIDYASRNYI